MKMLKLIRRTVDSEASSPRQSIGRQSASPQPQIGLRTFAGQSCPGSMYLFSKHAGYLSCVSIVLSLIEDSRGD